MFVHSYPSRLGKVWGYRTATVQDRMLVVEMRGTDGSEKKSYEWFKALLGDKWNNHICFELVNDDKILYCQWSDWTLYIGLTLVEHSW